MFGRKARRITELEDANTNLNRRLQDWEDQWKERNNELPGLRNQVEYLVRTIRQMDDQIFGLSQAMPNVTQAQPYVRVLCDGMTARKVAESDRIADILRPQLIETYKPKDDPNSHVGFVKRLGK